MSNIQPEILERIAVALETIAACLQGDKKDAFTSTAFIHGVDRGPPDSPAVAERSANPQSSPKHSPPDGSQPAAPQEPSAVPPPGLTEVRGFFASRRISLKTLRPADPADQVLDRLAKHIGDHFHDIKRVLADIKRFMQRGESFSIPLQGATQKAISLITSFCFQLHEVAFLEKYKYVKSPTKVAYIKTTQHALAQGFLSGGWLERFIRLEVESVHATLERHFSAPVAFEVCINPQVVLPNGDDFELDVVAVLHGRVIWIEAKTGDFQQHVAKYAKIARIMKLEPGHSMMVLLDAPDSQRASLAALFHMAVLGLEDLRTHLLSLFLPPRYSKNPGSAE